MCEGGRGDHVWVGACSTRLVWRGTRVEPVAELEARVPQVSLACAIGNEVNPRPHALELRCQHTCIAVALVEHPWHNHCGVTPGGCGHGGHGDDVGDDERHDAPGSDLFDS